MYVISNNKNDYTGWTKNARPNLQKVNLHRSTRKNIMWIHKTRGYWRFKEDALHCTLWRTRFGRDYGPVVRQTTEWMRPSEASFPSYDLLTIKENIQLVHLELQRRMLHVWPVIAWLAGKYQMSYESSQTHSVLAVASPGRHRLL